MAFSQGFLAWLWVLGCAENPGTCRNDRSHKATYAFGAMAAFLETGVQDLLRSHCLQTVGVTSAFFLGRFLWVLACLGSASRTSSLPNARVHSAPPHIPFWLGLLLLRQCGCFLEGHGWIDRHTSFFSLQLDKTAARSDDASFCCSSRRHGVPHVKQSCIKHRDPNSVPNSLHLPTDES